MLDERKLAVLRAIVEDFVATSEPVGSKALAERHSLGVSSATIRNDMATLEDEGYITQPHTSAGRVPTDLGYRMFVDRLSTVKPLSQPEKRAISAFLEGAVDLDDVMQKSVKLLANLTHQVAMVQYPSLTRSSVRSVELIFVPPSRIILVLVTDTGRVEQRIAEVPADIDDDFIIMLRARINALVAGKPLAEVPALADQLIGHFPAERRPVVSAVTALLLDTVAEQREERVVISGASNLARTGQDFHGGMHSVLEALEEHVVLLRLLAEAANPDEVTVRIGAENRDEGLTSASIVTTAYGSSERSLAALGVVGPTRMDYPGTIAAVQTVARYVGRIVADA